MITFAEDKIIKFKRGLKENLPSHGIEGMPYFTMDTGEIYMGLGDDKALKKIAVQEKVITFVCWFIRADNTISI